MKIELRQQTLEEGRLTYDREMHRDFPEDELKPWEITVQMYEAGIYEMLEAFVDGTLVGYAWMVFPKGGSALIDYLAVLPQFRCGGYGTAILEALSCRYSLRGMELLLESEFPEEAPDPAMARRRLGFYQRAGFRDSGVQVRLFGVRFCILVHGDAVDAKEQMTHLYRAMFSDPLFREAVQFLN